MRGDCISFCLVGFDICFILALMRRGSVPSRWCGADQSCGHELTAWFCWVLIFKGVWLLGLVVEVLFWVGLLVGVWVCVYFFRCWWWLVC